MKIQFPLSLDEHDVTEKGIFTTHVLAEAAEDGEILRRRETKASVRQAAKCALSF